MRDERIGHGTSAPDEDLERRAEMHAALGEPVRLAVIDHLALGDASPGELSSLTGLATNLLAFHLNVLQGAGLIRRVRSEGDRRRSYVQLRRDDAAVAALLTPSPVVVTGPVQRVVFVCTHNSARSQLAAAAWAQVSAVPVTSAGTHPAARVHPRAVTVGRRHGLRLARARTHRVDDTLRPGDLIVAVCDNAHEELTATTPPPYAPSPAPPVPARGWLHWAIPDPVRVDTDAAFETAYTDLIHRVDRLAGAITPAPHDTASSDTTPSRSTP